MTTSRGIITGYLVALRGRVQSLAGALERSLSESIAVEGSAIAEMPQEMIPSDLTWRVPLKPHPLPLVSYPFTSFSIHPISL